MHQTPLTIIESIKRLRFHGHSLKEISKTLGVPATTVAKYIKNVPISQEGRVRLESRNKLRNQSQKEITPELKAQIENLRNAKNSYFIYS